jgi:orotate phosphoribosyltransferase
MPNIILHLSDLHVSLNQVLGGGHAKVDFRLSTSADVESGMHYVNKFIQIIKRDYLTAKVYLLITGDITNEGEIKEFEFASKFINKIIDDLNIEKTNILLIPGDHDLNRRAIQNLYADNENPSPNLVNQTKFANFSKFYLDLLGKTFDPSKVIHDILLVEDRLILMGLNSCIGIDLKQLEGSITIAEFEQQYRIISETGKKVIACTHHNLASAYENKNAGQWISDNRTRFISKLIEFDINLVLSGNEHINSTRPIPGDQLTVSDAGCLTTLSYDATFKVYPLEIGDDIILQNKIYALQKISDNNFDYEWDIRSSQASHQPEEYVIFKKQPPHLDPDIIEITVENMIAEEITEITNVAEISTTDFESYEENFYYNPEFTDILYDKIKDLKIFYTGHYHYSETSRAHNWIDVSKLIENKDNLNFLKNAIIDVLEEKIHEENIDMIIGLGYEGNIISTKAAIKFNKPYSFLPYSYRHDEHHESERLLNFDNSEGNFKNILIVTDVVNDGRTIRKLVKKRQDPFFQNVDKIYVISLFYTGQHSINNDILNYSFLEKIPNYDLENDEVVNNIEFYTVKSLKVEKCPYGKDFRTECFIYKDELSCVHLFYDERKYFEK